MTFLGYKNGSKTNISVAGKEKPKYRRPGQLRTLLEVFSKYFHAISLRNGEIENIIHLNLFSLFNDHQTYLEQFSRKLQQRKGCPKLPRASGQLRTPKIFLKNKQVTSLLDATTQGEAYKVSSFRNNIAFIANYSCAGDNFHEITSFRDLSGIPNTEKNFIRLPYRRPKNCQIPNASGIPNTKQNLIRLPYRRPNNCQIPNASGIPNTEQNLIRLPYRRPKNCQIPNAVISYAPPPIYNITSTN